MSNEPVAGPNQIERDNLDELIAAAEGEHGPVTDEEIAAKREELVHARNAKPRPRTSG